VFLAWALVVASFLIPPSRNYAAICHVHAACPCFISLLNVYDTCRKSIHVHAAFLCCMIMLRVHPACLRCMSMLHVYPACPCCLSMLHALVNAACHVHGACSCRMSLWWKWKFRWEMKQKMVAKWIEQKRNRSRFASSEKILKRNLRIPYRL
jgi:hypothetical protein